MFLINCWSWSTSNTMFPNSQISGSLCPASTPEMCSTFDFSNSHWCHNNFMNTFILIPHLAKLHKLQFITATALDTLGLLERAFHLDVKRYFLILGTWYLVYAVLGSLQKLVCQEPRCEVLVTLHFSVYTKVQSNIHELFVLGTDSETYIPRLRSRYERFIMIDTFFSV